jgi:surfeit locus 1 family protein
MKAAISPVQRNVRLIPTLAACGVIALALAAGRWQVHRAAEKAALQATLELRRHLPALDLNALADSPVDAQAWHFRVARVRGHYLPAGQIYIDNRNDAGLPGYHVLTPLALGRHVLLVNRGFLPRDASYPRAPSVPVPAGELEVTGPLSLAAGRFLELSAHTVDGPVWQNLKLERYATDLHLDPWPLVLLASPASAGLRTVVETPDAGIDMHRGYAFQWFSIASLTAALYLYFSFFRRPSSLA